MRATLVLLLLSAPLLGGRASAAPGKPLLVNGGFEDGIKGWTVESPTGLLKAEADRKEKRTGKASCRVRKAGGKGIAADYVAGRVDDPPEGKVRVSAQVKGADLKNAWVKFYVLDASGTSIAEDVDLQMLRGTFDWKKVEGDFTVPKGAKRAEVRLYLFLDGEVWIDDVTVESKSGKPSGDGKSKKPLDAATASWLEQNSVRVKTLDLDGPLDDLAPLADRWKDARIVQLGENTHGDGACFEAKARLIRFLHERMGFDVVAFESGLFECDRANALLREGKAQEALDASVFGIWRVSQVRPLFKYLATRASTKTPLLLAGFDCRASGGLAPTFLDRLKEFVAAAGDLPDADVASLRRLDALIEESGDAYRPDPSVLVAGLAAWKRIRAAFDAARERLVARHGEAEVAFFSRCLDNWRAREEFERSKPGERPGSYVSMNLRDGAMAANLRWLADVRYPGKKIVTWGATFHLAHGLTGVKIGGNAKHYEGCRNMGQGVHEAFGPSCVTVGFAAAGGRVGSFAWSSDLAAPAAGSVEETLSRYGSPLLIVDLRKEGPFHKPLKMAPMSYDRTIEARWPDVLDAVFFIEEMTAARP